MEYIPWYGLNGRQISDLEAEVLLADTKARQLAYDAIHPARGAPVVVLTMFTVTPCQAKPGGPFALWETIVVGNGSRPRVEHHVSREEAERRHQQIVDDVRGRLQPAASNGQSAGRGGQIRSNGQTPTRNEQVAAQNGQRDTREVPAPAR